MAEASINARVVLETFYGDTLPPCVSVSSAKMFNAASVLKNNVKSFYLGNNIPNPFMETTLIPYIIPLETEEATLLIHDVFGKLISTYKLNPLKTQIVVSLSVMESAVFYYTLTLDGKPSETKKMVLIK